jgi:Double zinc ribbon
MTATTCPKCGQPASGRFCSSCAAPLSSTACANCSAPLSAGARFCHVCGTPTAGKEESATQLWPWIGGVLTASVLFAALGFFAGRVNAPQTGGVATQTGAPTGTAGAIDLTTMTPREQADRLFDRTMREHEAGDAGQVDFFAPMALQTYQMLGPLDNDARYHVGLINAIIGETEAALAQADSLEIEAAGHLFTPMLRTGVYQALGQSADVQRSYAAFLENYETEMARGRPEYQMHSSAVSNFLAEARNTTDGGSN